MFTGPQPQRVSYPVTMAKGGSGRPRDERVDVALTTAVRELLSRDGYPKLTVDMIADRAEVGKPAIYRRFRSKAELVLSVVLHGLPQGPPPDRGSLAGDLTALVTRVHLLLSAPETGSVIAGLFTELLGDPGLARRFRDGFLGSQRDAVAEVCRRAVLRGELSCSPNPAFVHAQLLGPLFVRLIVLAEPVTTDQLTEHVGALLRVLGVEPAP